MSEPLLLAYAIITTFHLFALFDDKLDPVAQSLSRVRIRPSHMITFMVEIDHETIFTVFLLLPLIQKGRCQLQAK